MSNKSPFVSRSFGRVLPVLFLEYLSLSLARSLLPSLIVQSFGKYSYFAVGISETVKGILAFFACPIIGKISDRIGRKYCILLAMVGTTLPVCALAFTSNMLLYSFLLGLSGVFTATFALTFAYISDCVDRKSRAPAYGLALATFGLSLTIGPILGSYLAREIDHHIVFMLSCLLVAANVLYIVLFLPETALTAEVSNASKLIASS
jgi:MFS family permease